ncbi:hypothetical protein [Akkermansia sp.]|jgi:hypothetical protein|uniref:hypothetical protein n=1 Tax=Akkermansia sp. TaxID=1872421 RepID=UPI002633A4CF|nr:hypothetical protein [uncultured Akkermansia sp.]
MMVERKALAEDFCKGQKIMRAERLRFFKEAFPVSMSANAFDIRTSFTNSLPSG